MGEDYRASGDRRKARKLGGRRHEGQVRRSVLAYSGLSERSAGLGLRRGYSTAFLKGWAPENRPATRLVDNTALTNASTDDHYYNTSRSGQGTTQPRCMDGQPETRSMDAEQVSGKLHAKSMLHFKGSHVCTQRLRGELYSLTFIYRRSMRMCILAARSLQRAGELATRTNT